MMVPMTTPDSTPGEQPGNDPTTVTEEVSEQPLEGDFASQLEAQSADQLLDLITGEEPVPAATESTPPPASEQPPKKDEEEAPQGTPSKPPGRLSVRALPADQQLETAEALALVREGKAADLLDALQQIRGVQAPPAKPADAQADPDASTEQNPPTEEATGDVAQIEARLAQLRAERKAAKQDFDTDEEERLTTEIEDTLISLQEAKIQAATAKATTEQVQNSYDEQYQAAVDELEANYPDSLDDDSQSSQLLDDKITAARVRKDPALQDPRFILKFAEDIKNLLTPKGSPRPPSAPPIRTQRPTGAAVAPGHSQAPRPTAEQALAMINSIDDPDVLLAAITADPQGA